MQGDKRIARLFPDNKAVEIDFFKQTGIFPIMHVTAIKQEVVDKYPWVPTNLVKAFEKSKQLAYKRLANPRMVPLAFVRTAVEEQEAILGKDPWSYGLTPANRKNLETVQRYCHQQGLIKTCNAARRSVRRHRSRRRRRFGRVLRMTFEERLAAIRAGLAEAKLDRLVALHDGAHFIEKPDPVMVLTGFKALGPVAAVLDRDGAVTLVVTPSWDGERAQEVCPDVRVVPADDVVAGLETGAGRWRRCGRHRRTRCLALRHCGAGDRTAAAGAAGRCHRFRRRPTQDRRRIGARARSHPHRRARLSAAPWRSRARA